MKKTIAQIVYAYKDAALRDTDFNEYMLKDIEEKILPHDNGFDIGAKISREDKLGSETITFKTTFFHKNPETGNTNKMTEHTIVARPSFDGGVQLKITGSDRNGIIDYIADVYYELLNRVPNEEEEEILKEGIAEARRMFRNKGDW